MTVISYNLFGSIDPALRDILALVHREASARGILFFVIGATARDILLTHCHAIKGYRLTRDLDIGIKVADWSEFQKLSEALIATGSFTADREPNRLMYGGFPVDIVPYGGISPDNRTISWPPDHQVVMSIMGFQEAYDYSLMVRLSDVPLIDVRLPTIPGMVLMKLISWHERYPERPKDAEDLLFMMEHYVESGNQDRLYGEEIELLQAEDFDQTLAGIRLLGRDLAFMAAGATAEVVSNILATESDEQGNLRLIRQMVHSTRIHDRADELIGKIRKLQHGFNEQLDGMNA